jgi:aminoglycoside phosphotransferase (APT) family kinase protein
MLHEAWRRAQRAPGEVARAIENALELLAGAPQRMVHGDSHPGNVLWTADGPLWGDWEDAHLAPLEWDPACLVAAGRVHGNDFDWGETALATHGGGYDGALRAVVRADLAAMRHQGDEGKESVQIRCESGVRRRDWRTVATGDRS